MGLELERTGLTRTAAINESVRGHSQFLATVGAARFATIGAHFLGQANDPANVALINL